MEGIRSVHLLTRRELIGGTVLGLPMATYFGLHFYHRKCGYGLLVDTGDELHAFALHGRNWEEAGLFRSKDDGSWYFTKENGGGAALGNSDFLFLEVTKPNHKPVKGLEEAVADFLARHDEQTLPSLTKAKNDGMHQAPVQTASAIGVEGPLGPENLFNPETLMSPEGPHVLSRGTMVNQIVSLWTDPTAGAGLRALHYKVRREERDPTFHAPEGPETVPVLPRKKNEVNMAEAIYPGNGRRGSNGVAAHLESVATRRRFLGLGQSSVPERA